VRKLAWAAALAFCACIETTGGEVVDFPVVASGTSDASHFTNDRGWEITLTEAKLHIGGVYLNSAEPVSGAQDTACILPGTYLAQMTTGMDIDLLSAAPQRFHALGRGITGHAIEAQLWLTGISGDIDTPADPTKILVLAGTAKLGANVRPFGGVITISTNRPTPICKQRIVAIATAVQIATTGSLEVRIDAKRLFTNIDFGAVMTFSDEPNADQGSTNLYSNLHAGSSAGAPYSFFWTR
jgi:hypothetical protein